ncbi:MAG: hypothetical protein JW863_15240, partial [Chitinispirillaceae bacterium]|nr:hypothetical protein [Chitinispirillaceae bacterium]
MNGRQRECCTRTSLVQLPRFFLVIAVIFGAAANLMAYTVESVSEEDDGVVYTMSDGSQMKVQVCT